MFYEIEPIYHSYLIQKCLGIAWSCTRLIFATVHELCADDSLPILYSAMPQQCIIGWLAAFGAEWHNDLKWYSDIL